MTHVIRDIYFDAPFAGATLEFDEGEFSVGGDADACYGTGALSGMFFVQELERETAFEEATAAANGSLRTRGRRIDAFMWEAAEEDLQMTRVRCTWRLCCDYSEEQASEALPLGARAYVQCTADALEVTIRATRQVFDVFLRLFEQHIGNARLELQAGLALQVSHTEHEASGPQPSYSTLEGSAAIRVATYP
jgi:hypothetical protein